MKLSAFAGAAALGHVLSFALFVQPVAIPAPAVAKEPVEAAPPAVSEETLNGKPFCVSRIVVHARPEHVYRVLTDYKNAPKVFPQMKVCEVIEDRGATKIVHHKVAPNGVPSTYSYDLEIKEIYPKSLEWHRVGGDFKEVDGFWKLEPQDGGRSTLVTYSSHVAGGLFIPQMLIKRQSKIDMPSVMSHLKSESEGGIQIARKPESSRTE